MARRRSSSKRKVGGILSPTSAFPVVRTVMLAVMMLLLVGMVYSFGGTRFWAAGPFWIPMLLCMAGMLGFTMVQAYRTKGRLFLPQDYFFWSGVVLYVAVRATVFTPIPFETRTELMFLLTAWLLYGVMCDLGNQASAQNTGALILLTGVLIQAAWAIVKHVHGDRMVWAVERPAQYGMRASGTYICPNHFAHFLVLGMVVALVLILTPKVRTWLKIYAGYVLCVAGGALLLTHSRSGLLGAFTGLSVVLLGLALRRGWVQVTLVLTGVVASGTAIIFALLTFYPPMRARMVRDIKDNIRISQVWPDTWSMIKEEGLWGAGPGVYIDVFEKYREHFSNSKLYLEYAHNEFLNTLAEYGWAVSLGMLGLLVWMVVFWIRSVVKTPSRQGAMIPLAMLGLSVGTFVHAVFDFNLHIPANGLLYVALLGWLAGQGLYRQVWETPTWSPAVVKGYACFGMIACLVLSPFVLRLTVGGYHEHFVREATEEKDSDRLYSEAAKVRHWMPGYALGWTLLGDEYRDEARWLQDPEEKTAKIAASRQAYEKALVLNAYEDKALSGLVELCRIEKNPEQGLETILRLREIKPFNQYVLVMHGLILRELGRYEEALVVFEDARKMYGTRGKQIQLNILRLRKFIAEEAAKEN